MKKMKTKKLLILVIIFLALIPFRLPISVALIKLFTWINVSTSGTIPINILVTNVIVTKGVYNVVMAVMFCINVEKISRLVKGIKGKMYERTVDSYEYYRREGEIFEEKFIEKEFPVFWWTGVIIALMSIYTIADCTWTYQIAEFIIKNV